MQLQHVKHICDVNSSRFACCSNSHNNGPHFDGFGHAIITQTYVAWRNYLIGVELRHVQSYVFDCS